MGMRWWWRWGSGGGIDGEEKEGVEDLNSRKAGGAEEIVFF